MPGYPNSCSASHTCGDLPLTGSDLAVYVAICVAVVALGLALRYASRRAEA